ncbi:MAG TPA: UDP-glucose/GDP-mannose dehydrogenase family protein, partial [Steroidobacteraceae bacterium]|nr:UDP-glucose/GDP-mannose dehydrogenase family protein [Steroidobacteraceae bacterium]
SSNHPLRARAKLMQVTIFGSGYVGLVTGACLADAGNHVICVDVDQSKIDRLNQGEVPIHEPGLEALIQRNQKAGRIEFTTDAQRGVAHGLFQLIAVGTPPDEDGSADLKYVLTVAGTIGKHLDRYAIVMTKSTVPVGTADKVKVEVAGALARRGAEVEFDVVSNPEFLKEGAAIQDFMRPDRVVVGTDNPRTMELLRALYDPFTRNHERFVVMDVRSAELTKYAANAMLATKISFMNELANIAERVGADIEKVRVGIGSDPRIGYSFIYPGAGYGGSCFPKDVQALVRSARGVQYQAQLLEAVEAVNQAQKSFLAGKIRKHFGAQGLAGRTIALWGLAFKPNTDDMRAAPSLTLIEELLAAGASIQAFDPVAMPEARRILKDHDRLKLVADAAAALQGADALAIVTEWQEFRSPDFDHIKATLTQPVIFDGRNLYHPQLMQRLGFSYYGVGRGLS